MSVYVTYWKNVESVATQFNYLVLISKAKVTCTPLEFFFYAVGFSMKYSDVENSLRNLVITITSGSVLAPGALQIGLLLLLLFAMV